MPLDRFEDEGIGIDFLAAAGSCSREGDELVGKLGPDGEFDRCARSGDMNDQRIEATGLYARIHSRFLRGYRRCKVH